MAQLGKVFNAKKVDPTPDIAPLPEADYHVAVIKSELAANKNTEGTHIKLTLQVQDGAYRGRLVWDQISWDNPNPQAVEIGEKRFAAYCRACGIQKTDETATLHNVPFKARIEIKPDGTGNKVTRIFWRDGPVDLAALHLPARPTADEEPSAE